MINYLPKINLKIIELESDKFSKLPDRLRVWTIHKKGKLIFPIHRILEWSRRLSVTWQGKLGLQVPTSVFDCFQETVVRDWFSLKRNCPKGEIIQGHLHKDHIYKNDVLYEQLKLNAVSMYDRIKATFIFKDLVLKSCLNGKQTSFPQFIVKFYCLPLK